jgi:protein tyrosine phosphatase (PTP) superfamily phosphohydrolase (DUF442 family)
VIRIRSTRQRHFRTAPFFLLFLLVVTVLVSCSGSADDVSTVLAGNRPDDLRQAGKETLSAAVLPEEARISERVLGLEGISNASRVAPGIYRGAQPLPEGYATLKKMGIRTVINLRAKHSERKEVEALGMKSIEVPVSVLRDMDVKTINSIIDMMIEPDNQPVYVHCKLGKDRTGVVIAAYRMRVDGWSLKDAEAEMRAFGFNDIWHEMRESVRKYAKSIGK